MFRTLLRLAPYMWLMLQANPPGDDGAEDPTGGNPPDDANPGGNGGEAEPFATFANQGAFTRRMDREAKARLKAQAEELGFESADAMLAAAKAQRDAADQAQTDLEKAKQKADKAEQERATAIAKANERLVKTAARAIASELGVTAARVAYAVRLADLSDVTVDDDGEPDEEAIKAAIEQVLDDVPELKAGNGNERGGGDFAGGNKPPAMNPWKKETRNLTEQGRILRENPALATQLQREARG
jgi:hypothetical protein